MNFKRTIKALIALAVIFFPVGFLAAYLAPTSVDKALDKRIEGLGYTSSKEQRAAEAAKRGIWGWKDTKDQKQELLDVLPKEEDLGFGVVTDFQKSLSAPMTSSQSFIPITNFSLKDGSTLTMSMLGDKVFLTIEPGATKEEIAVCTGIDNTASQFTGCTRGLAFAGTSTAAVTANQKTHSSGSTVVMSDVHYVFNQYFDKTSTSTQTILGPVTFNYFPAVSSTTAFPLTADQLATKSYVDNAATAGVTAGSVSTTLGLQTFTGLSNCSTTGTCIAINASTTASTNGGFLNFAPITGKIYWDINSFLTSAARRFTKVFADTLDATSTPQTLHIVGTPVNATDAVNVSYVNSSAPSNLFGDGSDGASTTAAGTMTLTRDWYFTSYTVSTGTTINTGGYRIFATVRITNNGVIRNNGGAGGNGAAGNGATSALGGASGTAALAGTLPGGSDGSQGGNGNLNVLSGSAGVAATSTRYSVGALAGVPGGVGGNSGSGVAGAIGINMATSTYGFHDYSSVITATFPTSSSMNWDSPVSLARFGVSPGASGGGGGGDTASTFRGGAGGGGGGSGGMLMLAARSITNNWIISANGGVGGNGGAAVNTATSGGGGGGGGGAGGVVALIYSSLVNNSTITATGAAGGTGGAGSSGGVAGTAGTTGKDGQIYKITTNP